MLSYHAIVLLHDGQYDRLVKNGLSNERRYATTFKNDPQHRDVVMTVMSNNNISTR